MLNTILKKIIRTGVGRIRYILAMTGLGIALLLILAAIQLQANYNGLLHGKNAADSIANFLVVNKIVTDKNIGNTNLSQEDIQDLKKQPFVDAVGIVTASKFKVSASGGANLPFYTDLFFESVPDAFLDVNSDDWKWNDQSNFIPIIIPNMFLDLYNFGFANAQKLPQLTPDLIKNIPLQIVIQAPAGQQTYLAKVVGFSDRISSILVPQTFMDWANEKFGSQNTNGASRVIIKTNDPSNPSLLSYLENRGLKTDADKTRFSKYRQIVNFVVNVSWFTGGAMLMFALLIFSLFIELTIASCKDEISLLITLGSSPNQLKRFLMKQFFPSNLGIVASALLLVAILQLLLQRFLHKQNMELSPYLSPITFIAALSIVIILWIVHNRTIGKQIRKN